MNKEKRLEVYKKCNGHCAYCGIDLAYKDMQVDHIYSKRRNESNPIDDIDNINNLLPSCRSCNCYKSSLDLEGFRKYMTTLHERVSKITIVKIAIRYNIVKLNKWDGKFYFEK